MNNYLYVFRASLCQFAYVTLQPTPTHYYLKYNLHMNLIYYLLNLLLLIVNGYLQAMVSGEIQ